MSARRLVFVAAPEDAPGPVLDTEVVVLDTAWTPEPGSRADLVPFRPSVSAVLRRVDLFDEALAGLDAWAATARVPDRMTVDGVCWWFQLRPFLADHLHERMLLRLAVAELEAGAAASGISVPGDERALLDVARSLVAARPGLSLAIEPPGASPARRWPKLDRVLSRGSAWWQRRRTSARDALLAERARVLARDPGRVLVIAQPRVYQAVRTAGGERLVDPQLAAVLDRLAAVGPPPIVVGLEVDHRLDEQWPQILGDEHLVPESLLETRWGDAADGALPPSGVPAALDAARDVPLVVDGADLAPAIHARVRYLAASRLDAQRRLAIRAERMLRELRPAAIFLNHEGIRAAWLAAARRVGIPIFAVQHGLIYPGHSVYRHARHPGLLLPDLTFTYGAYERDVLLGVGGYAPGEVAVSGSPRLDLDPAASMDEAARATERSDVRRELGVADGDRLLVVSTAPTTILRRAYFPHMLASLLCVPLPGTHVVFKQHPGEPDEGPYRAVVEGLARAGGYPAPPMGVVRDVDLFRLLRAADVHLGLNSTVLTDAVVAGTVNVVSMAGAYADLLGYVAAGVAQPARTAEDLRAILADPRPTDPAARRAFLEAHFRPGDASDRIVTAIQAAIGA